MVGHVFWPWSTFVYNFTTLNIFSKDQRAMPVQDDESMFFFLWNQSQDAGYVLDLLSKVKMSWCLHLPEQGYLTSIAMVEIQLSRSSFLFASSNRWAIQESRGTWSEKRTIFMEIRNTSFL